MSQSGDIVFSTDQYHPNSVKSLERKRRGCGEKLIVMGPAMKRPHDWKGFLSNDNNKEQFIRLLLKLWRSIEYSAKLKGCHLIFFCGGTSYLLTSDDGTETTSVELPALSSTQEETDSRIILFVEHAASSWKYQYVRIRSPDSNIFFILMHFAPSFPQITIIFDTKLLTNHG